MSIPCDSLSADIYSMIMIEAAGAPVTAPSRMPLILSSADHAFWLEQEKPLRAIFAGQGWPLTIKRTGPQFLNDDRETRETVVFDGLRCG